MGTDGLGSREKTKCTGEKFGRLRRTGLRSCPELDRSGVLSYASRARYVAGIGIPSRWLSPVMRQQADVTLPRASLAPLDENSNANVTDLVPMRSTLTSMSSTS